MNRLEKLEYVDIDKLFPTDNFLSSDTIVFFTTTFPLLRDNSAPKILLIKGKMYIQDGHHQIRDNYERGRNRFLARIITPEKLSVSSQAYGYALSLVLSKARETRRRGYKHIKDLPII